MSGGKWIIYQATFEPIDLRLGEYGYIMQGDQAVFIDPETALQLTDKIAAWAVSRGATPPPQP